MASPRTAVADELDAERAALAETVELVGPDASTSCDGWTAAAIAAHVVSLDRFGGVPTFIGRSLVARGVRLNDRVPKGAADRALQAQRRRGFADVLGRLRRPSPALLCRPSVAHVGLFEVWTHHEDVRAANELGRREAPPRSAEIIEWLARYQRVGRPATSDDPAETMLWLAGRVELRGERLGPV